MKLSLLSAALMASAFVVAPDAAKAAHQTSTAQNKHAVTVAVFSLNDFHAGLLPDRSQGTPGAAYVVQTLDSLKKVTTSLWLQATILEGAFSTMPRVRIASCHRCLRIWG